MTMHKINWTRARIETQCECERRKQRIGLECFLLCCLIACAIFGIVELVGAVIALQ